MAFSSFFEELVYRITDHPRNGNVVLFGHPGDLIESLIVKGDRYAPLRVPPNLSRFKGQHHNHL